MWQVPRARSSIGTSAKQLDDGNDQRIIVVEITLLGLIVGDVNHLLVQSWHRHGAADQS
jgi:hypothetical protein